MEKTGKVSGWQDAKGFGFIYPDDGSARVFFHHSALAVDQARPCNGDEVRFLAGEDSSGRWVAKTVWTQSRLKQVRKRVEKTRAAIHQVAEIQNREKDSQAFWLSFPFMLFITVLGVIDWLAKEVVVTYFALSLFVILLYWKDKRAAQQGAWRIKESTLHILSLLGGWPGALLAQRVFRHKSTKENFRLIFWSTVVFNLIAFVVFIKKQETV